MHYINICTKQMSLQALYGIVAALTQLFSALNISSCSHLACYVHINKSPQLFKETRDEEGGRDYCVASMSCSARITIVYNYVLSKLCHPPAPSPSGIKLQRTIVIHCMQLVLQAPTGHCRQIYKDLHEDLETLIGLVPVLLPAGVLCWIRLSVNIQTCLGI